jgi:hypothetical protein
MAPIQTHIHAHSIGGGGGGGEEEEEELAVEVTLRLAVSQSAYLGIEHPCGTCDRILLPVGMLLSEI